MGFDIGISSDVYVCRDTGRLFYWGIEPETRTIQKMYNLESIVIPEEYRIFFKRKGRVFYAYVDHFNNENVNSTDVYDFLNRYPSWLTVERWIGFNGWQNDGWREQDHNDFKEALRWCCSQTVTFKISWDSY
jgi:hypothetical protein